MSKKKETKVEPTITLTRKELWQLLSASACERNPQFKNLKGRMEVWLTLQACYPNHEAIRSAMAKLSELDGRS